MPDMEFLKENDGLPSFRPAQRSRTAEVPKVTTAGGVNGTQTLDRSQLLITAQKAPAPIQQTVVAAADDPFRWMDFRVSYAEGIVTVNRGRAYTTFWSPPGYQFYPRSFIIAEETLPKTLTATQTATIYIALPMTHYAPGFDAPYPTPPEHITDPDGGTFNYYHTAWYGFDRVEWTRRVALGAGQRKFIFADTGFDLADWYKPLATIGPNSEVHQEHFGSIFLPSGFTHLLNSTP